MTTGSELQQFVQDSKHLHDVVLPVLSGCATFGATLALSTAMQKFVGVSTATKVLPTLNGVASVCLASLASERAAIVAHQWQNNPSKLDLEQFKTNVVATSQRVVNLTRRMSSKTLKQYQQIQQEFPLKRRNSINRSSTEAKDFTPAIPIHEVRVCLLGLLTFKLLGGRFWAISPSSYTHLGSFARWSIPCSDSYATANQRVMIEQMGRRWGCHTCGSRMLMGPVNKSLANKSFRFVGDHMPPKSVAEQMNRNWLRKLKILPKVQFRFYPQCVTCSNTQGSILSKATHQLKSQVGFAKIFKGVTLHGSGGGTMAHFHGWRFRINHLTGSAIAAATVVQASDRDIAKGNPKRLRKWQEIIENQIGKLLEMK
ncbi:hypothetical protein IV203_023109 [Nitzschia inconspicua]|uniref:Uncharacterized protein n=1 Tax=Nitzschia inconspicua TaxID=303405 RepID=A0A9K3PBB4_9STRA|nr:hypothetical protein IV203_023109 [Nitzschia inconspicua]